MSGGPYIGPRGGKWADPEHTIPWKEEEGPEFARWSAAPGSVGIRMSVDGAEVGGVMLQERVYGGERVLAVEYVSVKKPHRGKGYAAKLYAEAQKEAEARGVPLASDTVIMAPELEAGWKRRVSAGTAHAVSVTKDGHPEPIIAYVTGAAPASASLAPLGLDFEALTMGEARPGKATFDQLLDFFVDTAPPDEAARKRELTGAWLRTNWSKLQAVRDVSGLGEVFSSYEEEVDGRMYDERAAREKAQKEATGKARREAVERSQAHRAGTDPGRVSTPEQGAAWAAGGAMPEPLYHATLAGSGIMATGFKAREDLGGKASLGGGPEHTVSTTPSEVSAHKIAAVFAALAEAQKNPEAVKAWFDEHWTPLIPKSAEWARREIAEADKHPNPMVGVKERINKVSFIAGYDNPNVLVPAIMALPKPGELTDIGVVTAYAHVDAVMHDKGHVKAGPGSDNPNATSTIYVERPGQDGKVAHNPNQLHREHQHLHDAHVAVDTANKAEQGEVRVAPEDTTVVGFQPVGDWRVLLSPTGVTKSMNVGDIMGPALDGAGYKGVLNFHGLLLGIEHATGDVNPWSKRRTKASYGEFPGTLGNDGDPVDFLLGHEWDTDRVYVIQQRTPNGQNEWEFSDGNGGPPQYDEDKVVLGAKSEADARALFEDYYHGSGREVGGVLVLTMAELTERLGAEELRGLSLFKGLGVDFDGPNVAQFFGVLDRLAKAQTPPPGFMAIPGGKHGGHRKPRSGGGYDYWYPDQHTVETHHDWEPVPGVSGVASMQPGQFGFVLGRGSKLFRWTPEHDGDLPEGQTWMVDVETGAHVAVQASRVQPARGKPKAAPSAFGKRPVKPPKPKGDNLPPPPPFPGERRGPPPVGPTSETPAPDAPRIPTFEGSTAKPGTVLHAIEHGAYGVLRYKDAAGRTQVGMYVPKADQQRFIGELRGLTHAAVSHVARTHRIRERGAGGGMSPEYQDLYSAAQLGLVQATRSYKGKVDFRAHAYRYMKTYAAMEARDSLGRGVPVPSRIRRLTEGYLASVNRAQAMFGTDSPTDEQVARAWNVTKKHVYQRDLGRYVVAGEKGPEAVDQGGEQLPMDDWQVRTPTGEAAGKFFPGKLALVSELRSFTAGDRTEGSEWMEEAQVAAVLPRHAAVTMPVGTALHLRQEVDGILADMEPALAQALTLRWGLDGGEPMELAEMAEALKLTKDGASKKAGISAAEKLVNRAKESFKTFAHQRQAEVGRYAEGWSSGTSTEGSVVDDTPFAGKSYSALLSSFKGSGSEEAAAERVRVYTTLAAEGDAAATEAALQREASGEASPAEVDALRERYFAARDRQRLRAFHLQTRTVPVDPNVARDQQGTGYSNESLRADEVLHGYMSAVARRGMPGFSSPSPGTPGPSRVWSDERLARFLGVPVERIVERAGGVEAPPAQPKE